MKINVTLNDDVFLTGDYIHVRGDVIVRDYDPRNGYLYQEIRDDSNRLMSSSEIFIQNMPGNIWSGNVGFVITESYPTGNYYVRVVTESGIQSNHASFSISDNMESFEKITPYTTQDTESKNYLTMEELIEDKYNTPSLDEFFNAVIIPNDILNITIFTAIILVIIFIIIVIVTIAAIRNFMYRKKKYYESSDLQHWEFVQLQKKFGELSYDELYNLITIENPDYIKYINLHVEHTFGFHALEFSRFDFDIIQSCKLAGFDIDVIKDISAEELQYRKEAQEYEVQFKKLYIKAKMYKDELEILEKTCQSADDFKKLHKSKEYTKLQEMIKEIESNPILADADERVAVFGGKAMQASDRRVRKIYDEWCKNNPLQEFADEYDYKWISYLLQKLNTTQGHKPLGFSKLSYDILQEELNVMDRNKTTLANFSAPDGIPQEHIWNNCWYDESHKIYYTQDDNLDEGLQNKADSDPDHSQTMTGRRVWGFAEDQVEMFCGFPSVKVDSGDDDEDDFPVTYVRDTGKPLTEKIYRIRNLILPILREADMNEEMAEKSGSLAYQATEIKCSIKPSGSFGWLTPRLLKLYGDRFGYATIPINERVRRALFSVECDMTFDDQAPLLE